VHRYEKPRKGAATESVAVALTAAPKADAALRTLFPGASARIPSDDGLIRSARV
jgi:hypothetical protein